MIIPNGLEKEAWEINNPALGGYLLWIFAKSSFEQNKKPIHPCKLFCLFAFIFYEDTRSVLVKTRNNLQSYISKFYSAKESKTDIPFSIHFRVDSQKERTLDSLLISVDAGLLYLDDITGMITPNIKLKPVSIKNLDITTKDLINCSEKLGKWLADITESDLTRIIKVVY